MKKILSAALLLCTASIMAFTVINDPLPIGSSLPKAENTVKDISGKDITLKSAIRENGLLVIFSCNTCPVVKGYQERINEVCKTTIDKKIGVILLNPNEAYRSKGDSYDDMKAYAQKEKFTWFYAEDKDNVLADAFGATRTPEVFLFDKQGKLVYHGAIDDNPQDASGVKRKHLSEAENEMLTGKDVSVKESRSVGCSIKRKG
ncbi:MAG: thioredoxin family protein [Chitinophagaceae bacterium]